VSYINKMQGTDVLVHSDLARRPLEKRENEPYEDLSNLLQQLGQVTGDPYHPARLNTKDKSTSIDSGKRQNSVDINEVEIDPQTNFIKHYVSNNDTLQGLALKYGTRAQDIKTTNSLWSEAALFGRKIITIPVTKEELQKYLETRQMTPKRRQINTNIKKGKEEGQGKEQQQIPPKSQQQIPPKNQQQQQIPLKNQPLKNQQPTPLKNQQLSPTQQKDQQPLPTQLKEEDIRLVIDKTAATKDVADTRKNTTNIPEKQEKRLNEVASKSVPIRQMTKEDRSRLRVTNDNLFDL